MTAALQCMVAAPGKPPRQTMTELPSPGPTQLRISIKTGNAGLTTSQSLVRLCRDMRFGSDAKVLANCKLEYYRISDCVGHHVHCLQAMADWPELDAGRISLRKPTQDGPSPKDRTWTNFPHQPLDGLLHESLVVFATYVQWPTAPPTAGGNFDGAVPGSAGLQPCQLGGSFDAALDYDSLRAVLMTSCGLARPARCGMIRCLAQLEPMPLIVQLS